MKIAFVLSGPVYAQSNGIVSQGRSWRKALELSNHHVDMINMWTTPDWKSYDVVLFFGFSSYMSMLIEPLHKIGVKIVVAPIFDPDPLKSPMFYNLYSRWGCRLLRVGNPYHDLRTIAPKVWRFLTRSKFESIWLSKAFGISMEKCRLVPLSYGQCELLNFDGEEKENFCFHLSLLCDERKNVKRLINAAHKYNFNLKLGGLLRTEDERRELLSWIDGAENIEYCGFLSHAEKVELYRRAKVFALPSINEGVGIVALEAAAAGCEVVVTCLGGPQEYYQNMATVVDPFDVDEIGTSIVNFLENKVRFQPALSDYVRTHFSFEECSRILQDSIFD